MDGRLIDNWISSYQRYCDELETPALYDLWVGISAVASALQRKVWLRVGSNVLYPNLYVVLIGPSGLGKSSAMHACYRAIVPKIDGIVLAPEVITKERLYHFMADTEEQNFTVTQIRTGDGPEDVKHYQHASITFASSEWGSLIPPKDMHFLTALTDIYDSNDRFSYQTKNHGSAEIINPCLNMIAGTTPKWMADAIHPSAIDGGFLARCIFVWSAKRKRRTAWPNPLPEDTLKLLVAGLERIHQMYGEYAPTEEAREFYRAWYEGGMLPLVPDARFSSYNERRRSHLLKLAMIVAASESSELVINLDHMKKALRIMEVTEKEMPQALQAYGQNETHEVMMEVLARVQRQYNDSQKPIKEHVIRRALALRLPTNLVDYAIDEMLKSKYLKSTTSADVPVGQRMFKPNLIKESD